MRYVNPTFEKWVQVSELEGGRIFFLGDGGGWGGCFVMYGGGVRQKNQRKPQQTHTITRKKHRNKGTSGKRGKNLGESWGGGKKPKKSKKKTKNYNKPIQPRGWEMKKQKKEKKKKKQTKKKKNYKPANQ